MNDSLAINAAGISLVKHFEDFYANAYQDPCGIWTIGYGHTRNVVPGMTITEGSASEMLETDLAVAECAIKRAVTVTLGLNQFSALTCFAFNIGGGAFASSTLVSLLNRGWYDQVPAQLARWSHVGGIVLQGLARRRAAETALWNTPDNNAPPDQETYAA